MRIEPNISLRKTLVKKYWRLTRKVFIEVRQAVVNQAEYTDPDRLKGLVSDLLRVKPMENHLIDLWSKVGGRFAYDTFRMANIAKGRYDTLETKAKRDKLTEYEERMRRYAAERSAQIAARKAERILLTEAEAINKVIDKVIDQAINEGLSIPNTRRLMQDELSGDTMTTIENWEAERIARTEVGSASNAGSYEAMQDMGLEGVSKSWMNSGLPGMRESHIEYGNMGIVELDYEYNTGLKYPQDPDCELAEEVINCRCTPIWEIEEGTEE
jgi:hypothetical protein